MNSINRKYIRAIASFKAMTLAGVMILLTLGVSAQSQMKLIGRVVDAKGKPIVGAVINVSELNRPVLSDNNGGFMLTDVRSNDDIVVSMNGFRPVTLTADLSKDMVIVLEPDGGKYNQYLKMPYKDIKLKNMSSAVSTMTGKDLEKQPVNELQNAFMGSLTGVVTRETRSEPGWGTTEIYIRGLRTTNATARAPLIIVDDIERDLSFLDAYPIENVTVLKDAAASAIYGMKGANGVIIVTTKRGTPGKTKINISQEVGFQNIARMPDYQNSYNYAMTYNRALYLDGKPLKYTDEQLGYYKMAVDGTIPDDLKYKYVNTDWEGEILRDFAPQYRTNVNISGGGKSVRYFTSFSYMRQEGFYEKKWANYNDWSTQHNFSRFNLRSNVDIDVTKRLNVSLDLGGRLDNISQPRCAPWWVWGVFTWMAESNPTMPILNPNGSFAVDQTINKDNPAALVAGTGVEKNRRRNIYTNVKADLDLDFITEGLSVKGLIGFDFYNTFQMGQEQAWNAFYYNPDNKTYTRMRTGTLGLGDTWTSARDMSYNVNMMGWLDYSTKICEDHDINAMAIMRTYQNVIPGFTSSTRYLTYNGVVNYTFRDKMSLQAIATYMGSDNYRKGDRYGFFPGASVSYNIAEENVFKRGTVVDLLKVRASLGRTGQNNIGLRRYPYQSQYKEGNGYAFGTSQSYMQGTFEEAAGNLNAKWEISEMLNVGVDFDLWHSKLYGNLDLFKEWRSNILVARSTLNDLLGIASIPMDAYGKVQSKGLEAVLGHRGKVGKVNYFVEANATYNVNKIIDIDEVTPQYGYQSITGNKIDQPLLYRFEKFFQSQEEIDSNPFQLAGTKPGHGMYSDTNGDKTVNELDMVRMGYNAIPEIVAGLNFGVEWKGISARVLLVGQFNRTVELRENVDAGFFWTGKSTQDVTKTWGYYTNDPYDQRNVNAKYPRLTTERTHDRSTYQLSDLWWTNGNLLSIRNVEVGYSLPQKLISKWGLAELRVYLSGYNLYTFDHIKTLDAENPMNYLWGYPKSRVFSMGINIGF